MPAAEAPPASPLTEAARTAPARVRTLALLLLAAPLAAFAPTPAGQGRTAPAGYVYYGDAELGQAWSTKNFDNLTRSDTPAFRGTESADLSIRVGDVLRARHAVNVRDRPWLTQPEEPRVVGRLRAGERVVVREIHWVGLSPGLQRSAFWIGFDRAGSGS